MIKKFMFFSTTIILVLLNTFFVFANAELDKSKVTQGLVTIKYFGDTSKTVIKTQVEKGTEKYNYTITSASTDLPLQMGAGEYKVSILENVGGNRYKPLVTEVVQAKDIDEKAMFKASTPIVNFSSEMKAIIAFKQITEEKTTDSDKSSAIHENIVKNYSYDYDKASSVKNDYVPVIDEMHSSKKGICYDYAVLMAGTLRSQGVPSKLVMGYAPEIEEYHAWNEILIDGKWVVVDSTYDAIMEQAGAKYSFAKDASKFKVLKVY